MISKTVTFKNMFGNEVTETHYFNLTEAELAELYAKYEDEGGFDQVLKKMGEGGQNGKYIMAVFKDVIGRSYGVRRDDKFVKPRDVLEEFYAGEAYNQIFVGLMTGTEDPYAFIRGIMPDTSELDAAALAKTSSSESARAASEAQMQGHKKPAEKVPETVYEDLNTAAPVLETPEETKKREEYEAFMAWKNAQTGA